MFDYLVIELFNSWKTSAKLILYISQDKFDKNNKTTKMNSSGKIIILLVTLSLYLIGISSKSISKRVSFICFIN